MNDQEIIELIKSGERVPLMRELRIQKKVTYVVAKKAVDAGLDLTGDDRERFFLLLFGLESTFEKKCREIFEAQNIPLCFQKAITEIGAKIGGRNDNDGILEIKEIAEGLSQAILDYHLFRQI